MAQSTSSNTIARQTVEELATRLAEPSWLAQARLTAWEAYLLQPMPGERDEQWRRTAISRLDLTRLVTLEPGVAVESKTPPALPQDFAQAQEMIGEFSGSIVQRTTGDGVAYLNPAAAAKGVIYCDISTAVRRHADKIRPYLEGVTHTGEDGKFTLLTSALFNCGMFLYVPKGVELSEPFLYGVEWSCETNKSSALLPFILVVAEENSAISLVAASFAGKAQEKTSDVSLIASQSRVYVKPGARVRWLDVADLESSIFAIGRTDCLIERDGRFEALLVALGAGQVKQDVCNRLTAPGASSDMLGVVLGAGKDQFSFNTIVEHESTDTTSNINFRVALKDEAASVYQGIVRVAKVAQRTDAFQSNKNLLLSGKAKADSIPKLEILADDVKCAHGATVGPVDREQLFYLQSRGLSPEQAEEFVVLGFFRQVLEAFKMPSALAWLSKLVSEKLLGENSEAVSDLFFKQHIEDED